MTKLILLIILGLHGLIHLIGFVKAFHLAEVKQLTQNIPKSFGLIWLLAFFLFVATMIQYLLRNEYWWLTAFIAIIRPAASR